MIRLHNLRIELTDQGIRHMPFGVGDKPAAYYVRRGGNNFHATPDEIRALVRARSAPPNPYFRIGL